MQDDPPDPGAWAKYLEEHQAAEDEFEADLEAAERMVTLLAWLYRQRQELRDTSDPACWPGVWPMDWPDIRALVFREPLLFDLARHQVAEDLLREPTRPMTMFQEFEQSDHAASLLKATRPRPGQGSKEGDAGIRALVFALLPEVRERNAWGVKSKRIDPSDHWPEEISIYSFCKVLADRLVAHPLLADAPTAVPSAESIRSLFQLG